MAVACGRGGIRHTSPLIFFTLFVLIGSSKVRSAVVYRHAGRLVLPFSDAPRALLQAQDIGGDTFRSLLAVNSRFA